VGCVCNFNGVSRQHGARAADLNRQTRRGPSPPAVDAAQWLQKGLAHSGGPIRCARLIGGLKPLVDPAHKVSAADIGQEQEQGVAVWFKRPPVSSAFMRLIWSDFRPPYSWRQR
jgi:hypothetical protein